MRGLRTRISRLSAPAALEQPQLKGWELPAGPPRTPRWHPRLRPAGPLLPGDDKSPQTPPVITTPSPPRRFSHLPSAARHVRLAASHSPGPPRSRDGNVLLGKGQFNYPVLLFHDNTGTCCSDTESAMQANSNPAWSFPETAPGFPLEKKDQQRQATTGLKQSPKPPGFSRAQRSREKCFLLSSCSASSELKASSECHLGAVWPRWSIFTGENGILKGKVEQKRKRY